jgi:hypothetical protein
VPDLTAPLFEGFPLETFSWFDGLEEDNSKGYFTAHRQTYALGHCRSTWAGCAPINAWLDTHVGATELPEEARYGRAARSR